MGLGWQSWLGFMNHRRLYIFICIFFGLCLTTLTSSQALALSSVPPIAVGVMVKPPQWSVKLLPTVNVASLKSLINDFELVMLRESGVIGSKYQVFSILVLCSQPEGNRQD